MIEAKVCAIQIFRYAIHLQLAVVHRNDGVIYCHGVVVLVLHLTAKGGGEESVVVLVLVLAATPHVCS